MTDMTFALAALATAILAWTIWAGIAAVRARRRLAGVRLVTCPESGTVAAVSFDRDHAALTAFATRHAEVRLDACSRWTGLAGCDEACLPEAEAQSGSMSDLIARWTGQRRCALCGGRLVEAGALGHHVALRSPDGATTEWPDLSLAALPEALLTSKAVCWNCHIAESFRRSHPELVTDR